MVESGMSFKHSCWSVSFSSVFTFFDEVICFIIMLYLDGRLLEADNDVSYVSLLFLSFFLS